MEVKRRGYDYFPYKGKIIGVSKIEGSKFIGAIVFPNLGINFIPALF